MTFNIKEAYLDNIPHSIVVKMRSVYDTLKTAERKAANLLLERPGFFKDASIIDAANSAGCSEATFVRLARKLGYSGYPELKSVLRNEVDENPIDLYEGIAENDDYDSVVEKVFKASIQALDDTLNVLDREEYKKAVNILCSANKVLLCGVGDAATVAISGFQKFVRTGMDVQVSTDLDRRDSEYRCI